MFTDDPKHLQRRPKALMKAAFSGLLSLGALIATYHVVTNERDQDETVLLLLATVTILYIGLMGAFSSLRVVDAFHAIALIVSLVAATVPLILIFTDQPSRAEPDRDTAITTTSTTTTAVVPTIGTTASVPAPTTTTTSTTVAETAPQPTVGRIQWVTKEVDGPALCLHTPSAEPGTRVATARCDAPATRWEFVSQQIRGPSTSCLTAVGGPIEDYTRVEMQPCGFAAHQTWNVVPEDAEIQNTTGGCLDAGRRPHDQKRGAGSLVQMWGQCENSDQENWRFLEDGA